ncbi:serine hydrolase domain-containing protein [Phycicoccus flavus]|uniref:serine hydrolase domain-containing protein n=1 Tax=Phycicoccus flavus TaxID=2502783 RepID=UPI000FEC00DA|nr:serine hydrolase domain-containing protein [Phycicoccus flavus]NHA67541.1 beta-lactamase family protein [Phycicoccus flavus]
MTIAPRTAALLEHRLATAQHDGRLPSVVAGLVRDGGLVWSGAAGTLDGRAGGEPADDDTQYRMGSITKTFVAVCVLRLRDAGRLDLTDRFEQHVPGSDLGPATLEQLLSHAAGAQAETNGPWWERTPGGDWDALAGSPVGRRFRQGRRFHYSNVGYGALGRLLEVHHGTSWSEVVRTELLEPLGMRRTTTRPSGRAAQGLAVHPFADVLLREPEHDGGAMAPAGQLWTTVADLARWATFLAGDTAGLLDAATLAEMCEPHHVVDEPGQPWTGAHGLGFQVWNVAGVRYAGHGGSMPGFLAGLRVRLDTGDGVVGMTNTTSSPALRALDDDLLSTLESEEPRTVTPWSATGDAGLLDLVGTWHWGASTTAATLRGGHLVLGEPGTGRGARFRPTGEDAWVGLDGYLTGEPLTVVRRPDGTVSHLDVASFRFTRTPYDPDADVPGGVDDLGWH